MHFLCVTRPAKAQIFGQEYSLKPLDPRIENIQDILATDATSATELLKRHPDFLVQVTLDTRGCRRYPFSANSVSDLKPGCRVLIMKNGGIGDHIMLLPALRIFKEIFPPGSQIWLAAQRDKHPLYFNNSSIDRLLPLPLTLDRLMEADFLIDFSSRQDWYDLKSMNFTDGFLNFLQIDYRKFDDKRPALRWTAEDSPGTYKLFHKIRQQNPGRPLVLLNWRASNRLRDIPPEKVLFLARRRDECLFVVAQSKNFSQETSFLLKDYGENILDCSVHMGNLKDYIGAVANCDAVVSTDTGTVHLAEALGKPGIVFFGPTLDDWWMGCYRMIRPLRADYKGQDCRSPCGLTKNIDKGCPESVLAGSRYSPCLLSISEETIESAFEELMKRIMDTGPKIHDSRKNSWGG